MHELAYTYIHPMKTHLLRVERALRVLLVCEDQQDGVLELLLLQHGHELLLSHVEPLDIARVHHEDDGISASQIHT